MQLVCDRLPLSGDHARAEHRSLGLGVKSDLLGLQLGAHIAEVVLQKQQITLRGGQGAVELR